MRIRVIDFTYAEPNQDTWLNDINELQEWSKQRRCFERYEFADEKRHIITSYVLTLIRTWKNDQARISRSPI